MRIWKASALALAAAQLCGLAFAQAQTQSPATGSNAAADAAVATEKAQPPPPITLESFAQIPFVEDPSLSPDGRRMAGLFGQNGNQYIGFVNLFDNQERRFVGLPEGTEARWVRWVNDDNYVVGLAALLPLGTDRAYVSRLININVRTGKVTRLLWDLAGQNGADVLWMPSDGRPEILVAAQGTIFLGLDFWPTVFRVNVETGTRRIVQQSRENIYKWVADASGTVRVGYGYVDARRTFRMLYRSGDSKGAFREIDSADTRQRERLLRPILFLPDTDRALVFHDDEKGRTGVFEADLLTQQDVRTVFVMPEGRREASGGAFLSDDGLTLLGVASPESSGGVHWIDPTLAELQLQFDKAVPGKWVRIVSFSRDRSRMLVRISAPDTPGVLYYYNVEEGALQKVADLNNVIGGRRLSPSKLISYKSRDGLEIEAVLTLPKDPQGKKLPIIIMPHGGPWANDGLSYDYWAQFLAFKGYAVLQPNFRGSTGYGTAFQRAGEGQMGLAMQDDLTDGLRWAIKEGLADEKRACIVGASYGGYAAMWGIAKDPTQYRCAISIAGVSNLRKEVNDFGGYLFGGKYRDDWARMTPDFAAVSPVNAIGRISVPLLLIHGRKDVTVDWAQSRNMHDRMQQAGKTVEFLPLPMADHHFTREADRAALLKAMGDFLDKHNPAIIAP